MKNENHEDLERRLREALAGEQDPSRLERTSSALAELMRSRSALRNAEARARDVLGGGGGLATGRITLHDAIAQVLADRSEPMRTAEIRDAVNGRGLYQMKDGRPANSHQVAARMNNYGDRFQKLDDGRVRLKSGEPAGGAS